MDLNAAWIVVMAVAIAILLFINWRQNEAATKTIARKQAELNRVTNRVTKRIDGVVQTEVRAIEATAQAAARRAEALVATGALPEAKAAALVDISASSVVISQAAQTAKTA